MTRYQITVNHIHCSGCVNLIKLCLAEAGFTDVIVNEDTKLVLFGAKEEHAQVVAQLNKAFTEISPLGYNYEHLSVISA